MNLQTENPPLLKDAIEYWKSGVSHSCCPDHWKDCVNAWVLADEYLRQKKEIQSAIESLQLLIKESGIHKYSLDMNNKWFIEELDKRINHLKQTVDPFDDECDEDEDEEDDIVIFDSLRPEK